MHTQGCPCVGALRSRGARLTWMPGRGLKLLCLPNAATSGASACSPRGNGNPRGLHLLSGHVVPRTRCRATPCHATVPSSPPHSLPPHAVSSSNHFKAMIEPDQMRGWCVPPRVVPPTGKSASNSAGSLSKGDRQETACSFSGTPVNSRNLDVSSAAVVRCAL